MSTLTGALAVAAAITATAPLSAYLARHDPGPLHRRSAAHRRARATAQNDRDLLRLARNAEHRSKPRMKPDHLAADEPAERHPDYCHTCRGFCGSKAHR